MRAAILASVTILALASTSMAMPIAPSFAPSSTIRAHGCHQYYAHDISGWHRHDQSCNTFRGIAGQTNRSHIKS
jgi:hypothetical protein